MKYLLKAHIFNWKLFMHFNFLFNPNLPPWKMNITMTTEYLSGIVLITSNNHFLKERRKK